MTSPVTATPASNTTLGQAPPPRHLDRSLVLLLSVATGLAVASLYYAQPLLALLKQDLHLRGSSAGLIVTVAQLGYAAGLIFLLPLGDLIERRRLIVGLFVLTALGLAGFGFARSPAALLALAAMIGLTSVVAQVLVPLAASLAPDGERGRVVGTVMAGLLLGILVARAAAGYLAEFGGWRSVYWTAAGLMLLCALTLRVRLPRDHAPAGLSYPRLLASTWRLVQEEPVLRLRMAYGVLTFGTFSMLWTTLAFLLAGSPYHYSTGIIGLFGLVGAAGAIAANVAGRLSDAGHQRTTTGIGVSLLALSWLPLWLGAHTVAMLVVGIVLLDLAVQGVHISNQSQIYRLRPEARARLTSAYMTAYFAGGTTGSLLSVLAYDTWGWSGVSVAGAAYGVLATALWVGASFSRVPA